MTEETHDWTPPDDPVFLHLAAEALAGRLPVYRAMVRTELMKRFDRTHRPELTRTGGAVMRRMADEMRLSGGLKPLWVYPDGDEYVVSDDYFSLALYQRNGLDEVMCFVLGGPPRSGCRDTVGPLEPADVARRLGFAPAARAR